jgi:hypothetical protein
MPDRRTNFIEALKNNVPNYHTDEWTPELIEKNIRDVLGSGDTARLSSFLSATKAHVPNFRDNPGWTDELILENIQDVLGESAIRPDETRSSFFRRIVDTFKGAIATTGGAGATRTAMETSEAQDEDMIPTPAQVMGSFIGLTWNTPARAAVEGIKSVQEGMGQIGVSEDELREDERKWEPLPEVKRILSLLVDTQLKSMGLQSDERGELVQVDPYFEEPGGLYDEIGMPSHRMKEQNLIRSVDEAIGGRPALPSLWVFRMAIPFLSSNDPDTPPEDREITTNDFLGWATMMAIPDYIFSTFAAASRVGGRAAQATMMKSPAVYREGVKKLRSGVERLESGGNRAVAADEIYEGVKNSPLLSARARANLHSNVDEFKEGVIKGEIPILGKREEQFKRTIVNPNQKIITAADDPRAIVPMPVEQPGMIGIRPTRQLSQSDNETLQKAALYGLPENVRTKEIIPKLGGTNAETRLGRVGDLTDEQLTLVALERGVFDFAPVSERTTRAPTGRGQFDIRFSSDRLGGSYSGGLITTSTDTTPGKYFASDWLGKADFRSEVNYPQNLRTVSHEAAHGLFSRNPQRGQAAIKKLKDAGVPEDVAFENLVDVGGLYLLEPSAITNPRVKNILREWLGSTKLEDVVSLPLASTGGKQTLRGELNALQVRLDELRLGLPTFDSTQGVLNHAKRTLKKDAIPVLRSKSKLLAREVANVNIPAEQRIARAVQMQRIEDALDTIHSQGQFRMVDYENPLRALTKVREAQWKDALTRGAPREEVLKYERELDELISGYRQIYGDAPERVINLSPDVRHVRLSETAKADIARTTAPSSMKFTDDFDKLRAVADGSGRISHAGDKQHNRLFQDLIDKGYARVENQFADVSTLAFTEKGRRAWDELVGLQLRHGVELPGVKLQAVDNFVETKNVLSDYLSKLTAQQADARALRVVAERAKMQQMGAFGLMAGFDVDENGEFSGDFNPWMAAAGIAMGVSVGMALGKSKNAQNFFKKATSSAGFSKKLKGAIEYAGKTYRGKALESTAEFGKLSDVNKNTVRSSGVGWTSKELDEFAKTGSVPDTIFEQTAISKIPRDDYVKRMTTANSTPEEATNYLYHKYLTPASDDMVDVASTAYLRTSNIDDYMASLKKPEAPREFTDAVIGKGIDNYYARSFDMRGNASLVDRGELDGVFRRHTYSAFNQMERSADAWTNNTLVERLYTPADMHGVKKGSKDAKLLTQVLEKLSSDDAGLPVAQLLQREDIASLVKASKNQRGVVGLATQLRKFADDILDQQNQVRGILEHPLIPKRDEYMPHIQLSSIMDAMAPSRKLEALDFIKPGKAWNPRTLERQFGIKWDKREQDAIRLFEMYVENSARREIFLNPFISQLRRYESVLREPWRAVRVATSDVVDLPMDYRPLQGIAFEDNTVRLTRKLSNREWDTAIKEAPESIKDSLVRLRNQVDTTEVYDRPAKMLDEWIGQVFVGNKPSGLEATTWIPERTRSNLVKGGQWYKGMMGRTVFALNPDWNILIQTSSSVFTLARSGIPNTVRGMNRYATNREFRDLMHRLYANHVKIYRRGTAQFQDAGTYAESLIKHHRSPWQRFKEGLFYLTTQTEKYLSLWSGAAEWVKLERMGYRGRALFDAASDGVGATQSMYDRANIPRYCGTDS